MSAAAGPGGARPDWRERPGSGEYGAYHVRYLERVPHGDVLETLAREGAAFVRRLRALPADREEHRYAPGKWTVREIVGHCIDTERVFVQRALWFARGDPSPLPGFEQDDWARASNAGRRPLAELAEEHEAVRRSTLLLFRGLDGEAAARRGIADRVEFTVRAIAWILAGHELHHRAVLEQRYLA